MNMIKIFPGTLHGTINPPSSKSVLQRLFLGAALAGGKSVIHFHALNKDSQAMLSLIENLGSTVSRLDNKIVIQGNFSVNKKQFHCAESGLCLRMLAPVLAHSNKEITIEVSGTLQKRPQDFMQDDFRKLGVNFISSGGYPPIKMRGPIQAARIKMEAGFSSQFLSGLFFSLPLCAGDSEIELSALISKPYIDLSLEILHQFGIEIHRKGDMGYHIPGGQKFRPVQIKAEGDWSAAANWIVAGLTSGRIDIKGLKYPSHQADSRIIELMAQLGILYQFSDKGLEIQKQEYPGFEIDCSQTPDLVLPLVPMALAAKSKSVISGVHRLVHKESNRLDALLMEFSQLGAQMEQHEDELVIFPSELKGAELSSHHDHRMAMALAVAALRSNEPVFLHHPECVAKSYPAFWDDLKLLGGNFEFLV